VSLASDELGFIYVRVPRTASGTFTTILKRDFGPYLIDRGSVHASAVELRALGNWDDCFTFGFIRNPWAWLVSMYNCGMWSGANVKERWPGNRIEPHDTPGIEPGQRDGMTFAKWVMLRKTTPIDWLSDTRGLIVDRVYRFEDFIRGETIRENVEPHRDYREYYTDELAEYVAEKCKREIDTGGYGWDDAA